MKRAMTLALVLLAGAGSLVLVWSSPSAAQAPFRVGWWTVSNPGLPPLIAGVEFPPNNVPDGGFEVAGTEQSPTSVAALVYDVPPEAIVGPLVLTVAEGAPVTPATELQACPVVRGQVRTDDGGPMRDAPMWDCDSAAQGTLAADGKSFTFNVARLVRAEELAIAIVPGVSAQAIFAKPGKDSLDVREADAGRTPAEVETPSADVIDVDRLFIPGLGDLVVAEPDLPATPDPSDAVAPSASSLGSRHLPGEGTGSGSAAVGSVVVALAACAVVARARRALDAAVASPV